MSVPALTAADAAALQECIAAGGVVLLPTDTVYGLACDPGSAAAIERLHALKGRPAAKPAAVMFFSLAAALRDLEDQLPDALRRAVRALLPGPVTLLVGNPAGRFPLACDPAGRAGGRASLGVRVPLWPPALAALQAVQTPVMQSSANLSGGADPTTLSQVPASIRRGADLVLDGGPLPGIASTVIDLALFAESRAWRIVREGALPRAVVAQALAQPVGA